MANLHNLADASNHRVPPAWGPEMGNHYPFRKFVHDIELWQAATDVQQDRQAPVIALRLSGAARTLINEVPIGVLQQGRQQRDPAGNLVFDNQGQPVMLDGVASLMDALRLRYGQLPQEVQLNAISDLMGFTRLSGEDTDMMMSRFEVALHRADQQGGVQFNPPIKAWMILSHLRMPRDRWPVLLAPTVGRLPNNDAEFADFCQYLRRNGHLFDHRDAGKTIMQPYFSDYQQPAMHEETYWAGNQHAQASAPDPWQETGADPWSAGSHHVSAFPAAQQAYAEDAEGWESASFSTCWSLAEDQIDWNDIEGLDQQAASEQLYLAYRHAKRKWRKFSGPRRKRHKGKGKGRKGKGFATGFGKGHSTFYQESQFSGESYWDEEGVQWQIYYKPGGKGAGKGTSDPSLRQGIHMVLMANS